MTLSNRWARIFGTVFVLFGILFCLLVASLWMLDASEPILILLPLVLIILGTYFVKFYDAEAAKQKASAQKAELREKSLKLREDSLRLWCPNQAIQYSGTDGYRVVEGTGINDLIACKRIVSSRIGARERELNAAIREFERQDRKANSNSMRRTASRSSFTRLGQEMRASASSMAASMANSKVATIEKDIDNLYQLDEEITYLIGPQLNSQAEPSVPVSSRHCKACGARIHEDQYFCEGCGREITQNI